MSRNFCHLVFPIHLTLIAVLTKLSSPASDAIHSPCCETVSGSCRSACEMITLIDLATKPARHKLFTAHLDYHCAGAHNFDAFQVCFNNTTKELQRGTNWRERECCLFAKDQRCRIACIYSQSVEELQPVCWQNKEADLYQCVEARKGTLRCCTDSNIPFSCSAFCLNLLPAKPGPAVLSYSDLILLHAQCAQSSATVHCAYGLGQMPQTSIQSGSCCNISTISACATACHLVANGSLIGVEALEYLIASGCGRPDLQEPFWICVLKHQNSLDSPHRAPLVASQTPVNPDTMKLHCCAKATNELCMQACFRAYGSNSVSEDVDDFLEHCMDAHSQVNLRYCLHDISAPCEIGCHNLDFCSMFNEHPSLSFRSCNRKADQQARAAYDSLHQSGFVAVQNSSKILVQYDSKNKCEPTWKTFLCAVFLQPCEATGTVLPICRPDCLTQLARCIIPSKVTAASALCHHYIPSYLAQSATNNTPCSSLSSASRPSESSVIVLNTDISTITPCSPNPCPQNTRCKVQRFNERFTNTSYLCVPGCVLEQSATHQHVVAKDIPFIVPAYRDGMICYSTCTCTKDGLASGCEELGHCEPVSDCMFAHHRYRQGATFRKSCSRCVCIAGEIICSAGYCLNQVQRDEERTAITGLPCSCPVTFNRVCGANGKTYPTECSARCAGLSERHLIGGKCSVVYSCSKTECAADQWCVERSEVCLDHHLPCHQHTCVDLKTACDKQATEIACDEDAEEHRNLCSLVMNGKRLAYVGRCLHGCETSGVVCGHDGVTYTSECAALAHRVGVEYEGKCTTVGGRTGEGLVDTCAAAHLKCALRLPVDCVGVIPPDACCPVCAGALRLLFSRARVRRLMERHVLTLTTRRLMTELQKVVQSSICEVLGYLTMEDDLAVIVRLIAQNSSDSGNSDTQEICVKEAERIHHLIDTHHPIISLNAFLWPLVSSQIIHTSLQSAASLLLPRFCLILVVLPILGLTVVS